MINLLPEQARREARREYIRRTIAVSCFMAAVVCAAGAALMLPISYGLKEDRAAVLATQAQTNAALSSPAAASAAAAVRQASAMLGSVGAAAKVPRPSAVVQLILSARPDGVSVQQITLAAGQPMSLTLTGVASTRDNLLAFKSALLAIPGITSADFPPADLAASSTVSFSMKVAYTPPPQTAALPPPTEAHASSTAASSSAAAASSAVSSSPAASSTTTP